MPYQPGDKVLVPAVVVSACATSANVALDGGRGIICTVQLQGVLPAAALDALRAACGRMLAAMESVGGYDWTASGDFEAAQEAGKAALALATPAVSPGEG